MKIEQSTTWPSSWEGSLTKIGFSQLSLLGTPMSNQDDPTLLTAWTKAGDVYAEFSLQPAQVDSACSVYLAVWTVDERSNPKYLYNDACGATTIDPKKGMIESINCVLADDLESAPELRALFPVLKELRACLTA